MPPNILGYVPQLDLSLYSDPFNVTSDWVRSPFRGIEPADGSPIVAQVVVQEEGADELEITQHPVQQGAEIHDHAFKRPAELQVRMGWSSAYAGSVSGLNALYAQILDLQARRVPFTVYTGRRVYRNMLVANLRTMTDARMEFTFMADIAFREVILVNTSIVVTGAIYNSHQLQSPDIHIATQPSGQQQVRPFSLDMSVDEIADILTPSNVPPNMPQRVPLAPIVV